MKTIAPALALAVAFIAGSPLPARADGWWEACSEREGGCSNNADGTCVACDVRPDESGSARALRVGSGLALLGFVGWRLGRKRRSK